MAQTTRTTFSVEIHRTPRSARGLPHPDLCHKKKTIREHTTIQDSQRAAPRTAHRVASKEGIAPPDLHEPIGEQNDAILNRWLNHWSRTSGIELWCGWGVNGARLDRAQVVFEAIQRLLPERRRSVPDSPNPLMLGRTASGQPRHPLYAPRNACLRPFLWADPEPIRHPVRTLTDDLPS